MTSEIWCYLRMKPDINKEQSLYFGLCPYLQYVKRHFVDYFR